MDTHPKVILLNGNPDASLLGNELGRIAEVTWVDTIPEALACAQGGKYDVLLSPWEPTGGTWRSVLEEIKSRKLELPVIVFHHCGNEREWVEVLVAGAFDLLAAPFDEYRLAVLLEHLMASRHSMTECARV